MKNKVLILIIMLITPVVVLGATCDLNKNNDNTNNRNLTCDANKSTITTFKTTRNVEALKNEICTISCSEELVVSFDPIKKVLAGTSFSYPLYVSGERRCTATYDYVNYEKNIQRLVSEYASLSGTAKRNKGNEITNYYDKRKACDNFTVAGNEKFNKYELDANVNVKIESFVNGEVNIPYHFIEMSDYSNNVIKDEIEYDACKFNETSKTCSEMLTTTRKWTETARVNGKYTMVDRYLEDYTGKVKETYDTNTCNAGDRYFVPFNEITRPRKDNPTDKGYRIVLSAKNLGDNILVRNRSNWNLNVECYYQVSNLIYPQQDNRGNCIDENCEEYGTTAFDYRIIDLNDPFPSREPGANWKGKESIISSTKSQVLSGTIRRFLISLNRSGIRKTREYNDLHKYDTFNLDEMEKSDFIRNNVNIVSRAK